MIRGVFVAILLATSVSPLRSVETAMVEYDIDGTAKYADITWNNGPGAIERKQVKLPIHESFRVSAEALAYVSAQKVRVTRIDPVSIHGDIEVLADGVKGSVHVAIHVNFKLASEATADAPFGIAKASSPLK